MRKKNNPGCPCCGYQFPCNCNATQTRIEVTNAGDSITVQGGTSGSIPLQNCSFLTFTGFSGINGVYYVDWPFEGGYLVLGTWKATNGPLTDSLGDKWCLFVRLEMYVASNDPCSATLCLCIVKYRLIDETECPNEDYNSPCFFWNPILNQIDICGSFVNNSSFRFAFCANESVSINQPTTNGLYGCEMKFYSWSVQSSPVLL